MNPLLALGLFILTILYMCVLFNIGTIYIKRRFDALERHLLNGKTLAEKEREK